MDYSKLSDAELDNMVAQKLSVKSSPQAFDNLSDEELDQMVLKKFSSQAPQERKAEAFTQGFGNAATLGYLPQIQAAVEPAIQGVLDNFLPSDPEGFTVTEAPKKSYTERRDQYIKEGQQLAEENPYSSLAGNAVGGISSAIAMGGPLGQLLGTGSRAATLGGRLAQAGKTGLAIGALRNPGDTEGEIDLLQFGDRAENAGTDALTSMVFQGGVEGLSKAGGALKGAGKELKQWSQNKALKSVGAEKPAFKKAILNKKNIELGQTVLDENIIGAGDDIADIAKNAEKSLKDAQSKLNQVYEKADKSGTQLLRQEDVASIRNEYMSDAAERLSGTVDGDEIAKKLNDVLETLPGGKNPTFGELRKWRASIDNKINYAKANADMPEFQAELVKLRSKVQEKISENLGKGNDELRKEFARQNKRVANLSEIADLSKKKAAGVEGNASFGMREGFGGMIGTALGTAIGGPIGSIVGAGVGAGAANIGRRFGNPLMATTANKVAMALETNPEILGKFADPLIKAAKISPQRFSTQISMMLKKPEFKEALDIIPDFKSYPRLGEEESQGPSRSPSQKFTRKNQR